MDARKPPRWTAAFLRALERTGEVRAAALDAGVDHTSAYARRRGHSDFAEGWDAALRAHGARVAEEEQAAIAALAVPRAGLREELLVSTALGGQVKRVGPGKWTAAAERRFFDELAATANVKRAAEAAGVSTNAVYARRMKQALFRAKWEAVLETGRAAIEMKLVEAANRSFDPDEIDTGDIEARVSVAEAIRIVQLHGSKVERQSIEEMEPPADEIAAVRERLVTKLMRLRERERPEMLAQGWSLDERHDCMVPPGWIKGAEPA